MPKKKSMKQRMKQKSMNKNKRKLASYGKELEFKDSNKKKKKGY